MISVVASDGTLLSNCRLLIYLDDVNDNDPVFPSPYFVFAIEEGYSTPPSGGRYVGALTATDADDGFSSFVMYSFVNGMFIVYRFYA